MANSGMRETSGERAFIRRERERGEGRGREGERETETEKERGKKERGRNGCGNWSKVITVGF